MKFIIIASTGKSGSTLLQRIINTIPNSNITGEKDGAIINILKSYKSLKLCFRGNLKDINCNHLIKNNKKIFKNYDNFIKNNIKPCWYNSFDFIEVKKKIRKLIISILDNNENNIILGYKEIRFLENIEIIDEFIELFPNTKVICHIRKDVKKQSNISWWNVTENAETKLNNYNNIHIKYAKSRGFYISYFEDLFTFNKVKKIFKYIGENINKTDYKKVIEKRF
tara:strand:- start:377 stop:1048 length:672 start_codon:yes stop_codon:yes gene_type:complete